MDNIEPEPELESYFVPSRFYVPPPDYVPELESPIDYDTIQADINKDGIVSIKLIKSISGVTLSDHIQNKPIRRYNIGGNQLTRETKVDSLNEINLNYDEKITKIDYYPSDDIDISLAKCIIFHTNKGSQFIIKGKKFYIGNPPFSMRGGPGKIDLDGLTKQVITINDNEYLSGIQQDRRDGLLFTLKNNLRGSKKKMKKMKPKKKKKSKKSRKK